MQNKNKIKIFLLIFCSTVVLPTITLANDQSINITEIAAYLPGDHEWIEIYNRNNSSVDLSGWKFLENETNHGLSSYQGDLIIEGKEYAIIADNAENFLADNPDFTGTIIDSAWSSLREDGEEIGLVNSAGEIIELFTYVPAPDTSLQRLNPYEKDYSDLGWQYHPDSNSAGQANTFYAGQPCPQLGDINRDTLVNEQDEWLTRAMLSGTIKFDQCSDIDGDGVIAPPDWSKMRDAVRGYPGSFLEQTTEPTTDDLQPTTDSDSDSGSVNSTSSTASTTTTTETNTLEPEINQQQILANSILINEFVSDPISGDPEWIELYNTNNFSVNLTGYVILDGSEAKTVLEGTISSKDDDPFFVIENPKGKLNNSGDAIILQDSKGNVIDQIFYGDYQNSFAPAASDPNSTASVIDGDVSSQFVVTETPTKGLPNIITKLESAETDLKDGTQQAVLADSVYINEIYPNPPGSDRQTEWIELYNDTDIAADLTDYYIKDHQGKKFTFNSQIILPGKYLVIERSTSKIALNNDKDTIKFYDPEDKKIQEVKYSEERELTEDVSYALDQEGNWSWTSIHTKNKENVNTGLNHPPEIDIYCPIEAQLGEQIICDASDSFDLESDKLDFVWEIAGLKLKSDIAKAEFNKTGYQYINLKVSDGKAESSIRKRITIKKTTDDAVKKKKQIQQKRPGTMRIPRSPRFH